MIHNRIIFFTENEYTTRPVVEEVEHRLDVRVSEMYSTVQKALT
jgi:hypothetical protein